MKETQTRIDIAHPSRFPSADDSPLQASMPAAVNKKEGKWRSRLTRWTIGGVLLAVAGWLAVPTILFRTSVRATVTAPLVDVRIPLQGLVCGTPPPVGTTVTAGEKLFEVQAEAADRRPSERIRGEIESIRRNAAALKAQIADLDKLKITLNMHFDEYKGARIAQAEKHVAEQDARINETASRLKTANFDIACTCDCTKAACPSSSLPGPSRPWKGFAMSSRWPGTPRPGCSFSSPPRTGAFL
jgi:hypothetical protein